MTADDFWKAPDGLEACVRAAVAGDPAALEEVLVALERRVYKLAWRLIGDPSAAEDITQEVLIRVARNLHRYRPGTNLWGWACRITINQTHDYRRMWSRDPRAPAREFQYDPELREQVSRLQEALDILTPKEREAVILLEVEGYTSGEAAAIVRTLPVTVRTRAAHARKKLRQHLSRYYPELGREP
jgi:RNA polymerase sigma-70 factor (ECF subfamily)